MGGRTSGSGNAAWRASRAMTAGLVRCRRCAAIKKDGQRCRAQAIRGWHRCRMHGGQMVIGRRKQAAAQKLKHGRFSQRSTRQAVPEGRSEGRSVNDRSVMADHSRPRGVAILRRLSSVAIERAL